MSDSKNVRQKYDGIKSGRFILQISKDGLTEIDTVTGDVQKVMEPNEFFEMFELILPFIDPPVVN